MTFALHLKRLRLERGLTQSQLARLSGIAQPNLASMEQGRRQPMLATLLRLAEALACPPQQLLNPAGSGLDRFLMDETCRHLVSGKPRPEKLDARLWNDLQATFSPKLRALRPGLVRPRLRLSARAAQGRLTARLGAEGLREVARRLDKGGTP